MSGLQSFQMPFAQRRDRLSDWKLETPAGISFADVISNAKPTVLIGTSGQPNAFTERIVRDMARHVRQPIIFPLSNPTECCEAMPAELDRWTEGRAVIGTGSPFPPLKRNGKVFRADQTNNAYVYPGIGLGAIATGSRRLSDGMFLAAAHAVAAKSPTTADPGANLLPPLRQIRELTFHVAVAVGKQAQKEGLTRPMSDETIATAVMPGCGSHATRRTNAISSNFVTSELCPLSGVRADIARTRRHTQRNASFHQKHGHVSRMACIIPVCALALHVFKMLVRPLAEGFNHRII